MKNKIFSILMTVVLLISSIGVNAIYADDEVTVDTPTDEVEVIETVEDSGNNTEVVDELFEEDVGQEQVNVDKLVEFVNENLYGPTIILDDTKDDTNQEVASSQLVSEAFNATEKVGDVLVTVSAEENVFPNGSTLKVDLIEDETSVELLNKNITEVRDRSKNVAISYNFDIKILDSNQVEVQPTDNSKVKVSFKLDAVTNENLSPSVYHLQETGVIDDETVDDILKYEVEEIEVVEVNEEESEVVIETEGFSIYTVEFTYDYIEYVLEGDSSVLLSTILEHLNLKGNVEEVSFTRPEVLQINKIDGDYELVSLKPFITTEILSVKIDGVIYEIIVTDAGEIRYRIENCGSLSNAARQVELGFSTSESATVTVVIYDADGDLETTTDTFTCDTSGCNSSKTYDDGGGYSRLHYIFSQVYHSCGQGVACPNCGADKCHSYRIDTSGPATIKRPNGTYTSFRVYDEYGNRVFCLDYTAHAGACSVYDNRGQYNVGDVVELAAAVGYFHAGGDGDAVQSAIWDLVHNGVPIPSYMKEESQVVDQHRINLNPKTVDVQSHSSSSVNDDEHNLGSDWRSRYTVTADSKLSITSAINPATTNTINFTNTDPYPLTKTITVSASGPERQGCGGSNGTVEAVWGSDGAQPWATNGQFEADKCHVDEFYGDSMSVIQPAGEISFFKVSERLDENGNPIKVSCPYKDRFGVSHNCESEFQLYMLKDANDVTWQRYNGTSIDMGASTEVTYEGKTYRQVRISKDGSGNNGTWNSVWAVEADGKVTTGGMNVPEGTFYAKEVKTNTRIWDLNPKYYPITVIKGLTNAIDGGTDSSGGNSGSDFPNQEFGALKIVKYTAKHTTKDNAEVGRAALTSNEFTDGFGNKFPYQARFRLYITDESPLWNSEYDYTTVDDTSKIAADAANNNVGKELHVLRIKQDGNTDSDTAQYEYGKDNTWTWEWVTQNGVININSIPVRKYANGVDALDVYVKEVWVNTDFQSLDRDYHKVTIQKNANTFNSNGTNRYNETNDLYASLQIDKYILGGLGKETKSYSRVHAQDTYKDSYENTYDAKAMFALYIDNSNLLWNSEYDCTRHSADKCPAIKASDPYNTTGKELHQVRIYKTSTNDLEPETNLIKDGNKIYEYRWTTVDGHIDITQIPVFPRNYVKTNDKSGTFYLKEIETNESIFHLNQEYKSITLSLNTNTKVEVDNAPKGSIEIHKYDEDSMPDGTPRKVKSDYCSQTNIDAGTYCDLPSNKALSDYFVILIDNTSPLWGVTKEQAEASSNGIDANIGAYDAGAYYAYDEDWGGLGYIKSISVAKDDKHNSAGTDSDYANRSSSVANTVSSGSVMYEMEFTPNKNEAILHVVKVLGTANFTGSELVNANEWVGISGGTNSSTGNVNKYTQNITETYEDGNPRVFEAGVHWHPDANGDVYIKYLPEGSYFVKEHSVDPNVFSLDEYLYKVDVEATKVNKIRNLVASELDIDPATSDIDAPEWTFANTSIKTGGLEFVKLDEEGHNAGAGHVYEIYYVNDKVEDKKTAQANGNSQKNAAGQWGKDISNSYELARTVSAKKHYLDGYLNNGKQIPVDDEGNKVVRFQIHTDETYLADHPGHYVYKGTGTAHNQFVTDENGRIYIERMPIGTYILIETETYDPYDLKVDSNDVRGIKFSVTDDQGKVFENGYRFSVDAKLVTCLNGKDNPVSKITEKNVCTMVNKLKNKNNTQVPNGLFADTETRTNQVKVGEHNAEISTAVTFHTEDRNGKVVKDIVTLKGAVNEPIIKKGSFKLYKYDEYGNTGNQEIEVIPGVAGTQDTIKGKYGDVGDKVFELYYLDDNKVFNTVDGEKWFTQGSYTDEELAEIYAVPEEIASRLQDGKVLSVQVDDVHKKGIYNYKHWKSSTVDFDNGELNDAVYQFITDEEGIIEIDQVPVGSYLLIEVGTTNAYLLNIRGEDVQDIKEGAITEYNVTNYNRNVNIEVKKSDNVTNTPLKDAEFVVYDITNTFRSDYQTEDMEVVPEGELLFVKEGKKIDLYDLLIKGRALEDEVDGKPVKYSMTNVNYAGIDSDGFLYSEKTGKVEITVLGGVYSLYGNLPNRRFYTGTSVVLNNLSQMDRTSVIDVNHGMQVIHEGTEVKFFKDRDGKEPVSVESLIVNLPVDYDINTAGTYNVEYKVITTDHIAYTFTRKIEFIDRNKNACLYYPSQGKWLQQDLICENDQDPVYEEGNEIGLNREQSIPLINSTELEGWNDKVLGNSPYEVFIIKDGTNTNKIIPSGQDATTIVGTKVQKVITGHPSVTIQDYKNHNYPVANGTLVTYTDEAMTQVYKTYTADEHGMVDLIGEIGKVDKLYYESYIDANGYYLSEPHAEEIDLTFRPGFAQVSNLKHSRKYIICETKTPNGYDYSSTNNVCTLIDTTDNNFGVNYEGGKRVIYSATDKEILYTLDSTLVDVNHVDYNKVKNENFVEKTFEKMIAKQMENEFIVTHDSNEEEPKNFKNESHDRKQIVTKYGITKFEDDVMVAYVPLKNVVFDVYEYYGSDGEDQSAIMNGTEYNWAAKVLKSTLRKEDTYSDRVNYVGRFSTGMIYETFLDDEGKPIANKVVEISQDPTFETIYMEAETDENGLLVTLGEYLSDGNWYYRLKRPLKPEYQACYDTVDVPNYCNLEPSENDYVQWANLPSIYKKIFDLKVSMQGSFELFTRVASTYIFHEVANYDMDVEGELYALPDDDVAYVYNQSYSGSDFNQSTFSTSIFNDKSRHNMGTKVDKSFAMLIDGMTIELTDTVHLEGLKPGSEYEIRGYLGDKQAKEAFTDEEGNTISNSVVFTADNKSPDIPHGITYVSMDVPVKFTFDVADILAKYPDGDIELVAMEELWTTTYAPRKVDEHKDWNDEGQTIELAVPKIGTTVINYEGNKNIYEEEEFKFTDTIAYENLMPGETFTYRTTIHVRSMEDEDLGELLNKEGNPIVVEGTFIPETRNGTFDVEITLDTSEIAEDIKGIVVFEELYYKGYLAAEHKDIKDDGQTLIKRHKPIVKVRKVDDKGELLEGAKLSLIDKRTNEIIGTWDSVLEPWDITELVKVDKTYILREEEGIDHYYLSKDVEFTVPDKYEANIEVLVTDMVDNKINYVIVKVDDSGEMLENAKMELYEYDRETKEYTLVDEWTTVLEEHDISDVVKAGHIYKVVESETPGGYYQFVDYTFEIPKYGTPEKISVTMVDVEAKVRFTKLDSITKLTVEGAKYAIFELLDEEADIKNKTVKQLEDAELIKVITHFETIKDEEGQDKDVNGKEIAKLLDTSKTYYVQEVEAPFGYELDKVAHELKITGTKDNVQVFESEDVPMIVYVRVAKADKNNVKHYLAGAEITIFKNDGTIAKTKDGKDAIGITDNNGVVTFMLNFDQNATYYAQETKAPAGYYLNNNKFEVTVSSTYTFMETDIISIDILDQMMIIPRLIQTGAGRAALIAVPTLAIAAVALILVNKKKGKKKEEE